MSETRIRMSETLAPGSKRTDALRFHRFLVFRRNYKRLASTEMQARIRTQVVLPYNSKKVISRFACCLKIVRFKD